MRLGELVESSKDKNKDGLFADVYSVTNSHGFVLSQEYFNKEVYSKELRTYRVVHRNMIAYNPSRINIGSVAVQDKVDNAIVSPLYVVFSADETKVIPGYLVRFLRSKPGLDQIAQQSIGTVRSNLKFDALCKMQMPLPSLQTQVERMNKLTLVEQLADGCENYLFHLDELVKSRFVEMFGDPLENPKGLPVMQIDEMADVQTGATPLRSNTAYYGGLIPWVKTGEVASGLTGSAEETITELALRETNCKLFPAGTILVAMYGQGDTRGKAAILRRDAATNQACAAILLREGYDPDFILAQLNLRYEDLRSRSLGGNQKNLSLKIIKTYELIVPPIEQQKAFTTFTSRVDKLRFEQLVALKKRGSQHLIAGESALRAQQ